MTQDEIIEMAREADVWIEKGFLFEDVLNARTLAFAKLVEERTAAKEREACADLCEEIGSKDNTFYREESGSGHCADAIRARGEAK